jgi:drug/metabolite transporter (DMT)-like permease
MDNKSAGPRAGSNSTRITAFRYALLRSGRAGLRDQPLAGALWVAAAMALLAALVTLGRYASKTGVDPLQVVFFRNLFCVIWMLPLFAWRGLSLVSTDNIRLYGMRVALSFIAMTSMFQAVALIPVGEVTAISFLSPLMGTAFAIALLGEQVRMRRWLALVVGFIGAIIILRPVGSALGMGQVFALVSACAMGVIGPLVKRLTLEDDADRVVFLTNLLLTPLSLVPALFVWVWPPAELWPPLIVMGLVAVLGHMALVRGYASMDASLVMTFKFVRLPFAVLFGYLAFSETIDAMTWLGGFIIFAASLYVTRREMKLKGAQAVEASQPPPPG